MFTQGRCRAHRLPAQSLGSGLCPARDPGLGAVGRCASPWWWPGTGFFLILQAERVPCWSHINHGMLATDAYSSGTLVPTTPW